MQPTLPPPLPTRAIWPHWEYKVTTIKHWESEIAEETLNQLGLEGWEMVNVCLTWRGHGRCVFKRKYHAPRKDLAPPSY